MKYKIEMKDGTDIVVNCESIITEENSTMYMYTNPEDDSEMLVEHIVKHSEIIRAYEVDKRVIHPNEYLGGDLLYMYSMRIGSTENGKDVIYGHGCSSYTIDNNELVMMIDGIENFYPLKDCTMIEISNADPDEISEEEYDAKWKTIYPA